MLSRFFAHKVAQKNSRRVAIRSVTSLGWGVLVGIVLNISLPTQLAARYPLIQGSQLYELASSLESMTLGGAALGLEPQTEVFADSPTAPASVLRKDFSINVFLADNRRSSFALGYIHPSDYGVFGIGFYGSVPNNKSADDDFGEFFSLTGHFSKRLSKTLELGFNLAFDYNNIDKAPPQELNSRNRVRSNYIPVGFHFDAAFTVVPKIDLVSPSGFSFRNVRYGVAIREIGLVPLSRSGDNSLLFAETIDPLLFGVGFDFLSLVNQYTTNYKNTTHSVKKGFKSRFLLDLGFSYPVSFTVKSGFKSTAYTGIPVFPEFSFSLGAFYNALIDTYFPLTGGFTFKFSIPETDILLKWAWALETTQARFSTITGFTTALGLSFAFGYKDDDPPEIDPTILSGEGFIPIEQFTPYEEKN